MSSTLNEELDFDFSDDNYVAINRAENGFVIEICDETFIAKTGEEVLNILRNEYLDGFEVEEEY